MQSSFSVGDTVQDRCAESVSPLTGKLKGSWVRSGHSTTLTWTSAKSSSSPACRTTTETTIYCYVWGQEIWTCHLTWQSRQISPYRLAVPPETGRAAGPFRFYCSLPWLRKSCGVFQHRTLVSNSLRAQTKHTEQVLVLTPGTTKEYTKTRQFPCQINSSRRISKFR